MTIVILVLLFIIAFLVYVLFFTKAPQAKKVDWGVNFSQMQAEALGLDWKKTYLAMLEDLGVKKMKILIQWDWVEGKKGEYFFNDVDWQVDQAQKHGATVIFVVGMKTGRWPECHIPAWAEGLSKEDQQASVLAYVKEMVNRYKGNSAITTWQVENEPLFHFGECPWYDSNFLQKEVNLVKLLDSTREVVVSDSGEQSSWLQAASIGDRVSVTMYRKVWFHIVDGLGFYATFPIPPVFYWYKAQLVDFFYHKEVFCGELQAEPWAYKTFYNVPISEQEKTMDLNQFDKNVQYAKATGLKEFYFWGPEWWYWMKTKQNRPEIWNEAKTLFN